MKKNLRQNRMKVRNISQQTEKIVILPSSFLHAVIPIHHNSSGVWNNPKGEIVIYKAAAPGLRLLHNKIKSILHRHSSEWGQP